MVSPVENMAGVFHGREKNIFSLIPKPAPAKICLICPYPYQDIPQ